MREWLAADEQNARQFEQVTEVWDAGSSMSAAGVPRLADQNKLPALQKWSLAAGLLLVCGLIAWGANYQQHNPSYTTRIGEQRLVRLSDGSRITLNSNSYVRVAYRDGERRVRLERGEAYFEVARNPQRPFLVVAGDYRVTALGTAFIVRRDPARTSVVLVEGKVAVAGATSANLPLPTSPRPVATTAPDLVTPVVLTPGQRLILAGDVSARLDQPVINAVMAWRRGELVLDRTTLADAVAEMNRYDEMPLVIDDPRVAALRVSGIYHTGDNDAFAASVARLYGLEFVTEPEAIHLRVAADAAW